MRVKRILLWGGGASLNSPNPQGSMPLRWLLSLPVLAWITSVVFADSDPAITLEARALDVLRRNCAECHRGKEAMHALDFILEPTRLLASEFVDPQQPDQSRIYRLMTSEDEKERMPPPYATNQPTEEEINAVRDWIGSAATSIRGPNASPTDKLTGGSPSQDITTLPSESELIRAAKDFAESNLPDTRSNLRFFSFRNLQQLRISPYAKGKTFLRDTVLADDHIALVKALNSLSWNSDFVTMGKVPGTGDLLVWVDISTIRDKEQRSWSEEKEWRSILARYPYACEPRNPEFPALRDLVASPVPVLRADWFIANALVPPLYHDLLGIPANAKELETFLKIDVEKNILEGRAVRIGFTNSKVSRLANRLVERHASQLGYYWKSYDFLESDQTSRRNIFQFPTGPRFEGNPLNEKAFDHDGGEIIFRLPNGFQGYMLVKATGERINEGPGQLVSDAKEVSGSPLIVNGLSCIACHQRGMIRTPADEVPSQANAEGKFRAFIQRLQRPNDATVLMDQDESLFMHAFNMATQAWGPTHDRGANPKDKTTARNETVGRIAKHYKTVPLGLAELASEFGIAENDLEMKIKFDEGLRALGLTGTPIKRGDWENREGLQSLFQRAAQHLKLGAPLQLSIAPNDNPVPNK